MNNEPINREYASSHVNCYSIVNRDTITNLSGGNDCSVDTLSPEHDEKNKARTLLEKDSSSDSLRVHSQSNIFRYKFTEEFTVELFKFSKIHQYDERSCFKEAWNDWLEENDVIVSDEVKRLTNLGYNGDVLDKMFKSARYYFRKKSTETKEPSKRRQYIGVNKDLLDAMDLHIKNDINKEDFKPSSGFDEFCKSNIDLLKDEVATLLKSGMTSHVEIKNKIKKTYKNRYFICTR